MNRTGIVIGGGIGKHISFSALSEKLKEKYGEVILVNSYPEVFFNNPNIYRNLIPSHPYLYEDYLKNISRKKVEPYENDLYTLEKKHIIEVYAKLLDINYTPDLLPKIYLTKEEESGAIDYRDNILKKDYIIIQISGGTSYYNPDSAGQKLSKSRDYSVEKAQTLVDKIIKDHPGFAIIQIGLRTEPLLKNVINMVNLTTRQIFPLMKYCKTFIVIDSFLGHLSAAFEKKGIVLWGGTDPKKLGYSHNINLEKVSLTSCPENHCHRPDTYFADQETNKIWSCPFDYECMDFDTETIYSAFSSIVKEPEVK